MKWFRISLAAFILSFLTLSSMKVLANEVESEMMQTEVMQTNRLPEGLVQYHNRVMLKKGYYFKQVTRNRANVISPYKHNVTGSLDCRCKHGKGVCNLRIHSNTAFCARSRCGSKCLLRVNTPEVTIMGGEHMEHDNMEGQQ